MTKLTWLDLTNLAVHMEERGRDFYRALAEKAENPPARQMLESLAAEEEEHAELFRRGLPDAAASLSDEQTVYLHALNDASPFDAGAFQTEDPRRALGIAIQAEKESILFYTELATLVVGEKAQAVLAKLLRAEKLHLVELRERFEDES